MPREICVQLMSWTKAEDIEEKDKEVKENDKSDKEE